MFIMPICNKCNKSFPNRMKIENKVRNLKNRKYCLDCSLWGKHNTKQIHLPPKKRKQMDYSNDYVKNRRLSFKRKLVEIKGGKCCMCGYNRLMRALQFHHIIDKNKNFELSSSNLVNRKWNLVLEEAAKTVLLCSNCHSEVEDGLHKDLEKMWIENFAPLV